MAFRRVNSEVFLPPRASVMIYKTVLRKSGVCKCVIFSFGKSEVSVGEENEVCWNREEKSGELELPQ